MILAIYGIGKSGEKQKKIEELGFKIASVGTGSWKNPQTGQTEREFIACLRYESLAPALFDSAMILAWLGESACFVCSSDDLRPAPAGASDWSEIGGQRVRGRGLLVWSNGKVEFVP